MRPEETLLGQPVRSLQTMLRVIAELRPGYVSLIPDGIYGKETAAAVTTFQRSNGLAATGTADLPTWDKIVEEYELARIEAETAEPLQISLNPNYTCYHGQADAHLMLVQAMLMVFASVFSALEAPLVTGILDDSTAHALSDFQRVAGLPMTGNLDKRTWKHLMLHYPMTADICNKRTEKYG